MAPKPLPADGSPEIAISVSDLRKRFRKFTVRGQYTTLKTTVISRLLRRPERREHYLQVLDGISFEVRKGEAVGVIGRNGAGKSTLLKLIAGILKPDAGEVRVKGRISPLIELGSGFHPEFSGRENIYLNGIVLGLSRAQVDERFTDVVAFSELGDFIDDPVRTYSSGMYMRLGFSIAIHAAPDILLVDEILAVGDEGFNRKCKDWIGRFLHEGNTLVLVTHDLGSVQQWCNRVLWLERGSLRTFANAAEAVALYAESFAARSESERAAFDPGRGPRDALLAIEIREMTALPQRTFRPGDALTVEILYQPGGEAADLRLSLFRADGICCFETTTAAEGWPLPGPGEARRLVCEFRELPLVAGHYWFDVALLGRDRAELDRRSGCSPFVVEAPRSGAGVFRPQHEWRIEEAAPAARAGIAAREP